MKVDVGRSLAVATVAIVLAGGPLARAADPVVTAIPAPPRRETHGLALSLGHGISYAGLGIQVRYDLPVWRALIVSPFVAAGLNGALPGPLGVTTMLGGRHRLALDLGVAPTAKVQFYLHGTAVAERLIYGPMAGLGYEHMSDGGWLQRVGMEYGYAAWGSAVPFENHHFWNLSFAFGRRIW